MEIAEFNKNANLALSKLLNRSFDEDKDKFIFEVTVDIRSNRKYTTEDGLNLMRFQKHTEIPFYKDYDKLFNGIFVLFSDMKHYPIDIQLSLKEGFNNVICVKFDPRYRRPSELHNQETGHPPFKVIKS